jgi:hypothetical protein
MRLGGFHCHLPQQNQQNCSEHVGLHKLLELQTISKLKHVPSAEVSKVPEAPTAKNETSDEVQVLSVVLLSSLLQEIMVRLKEAIRIICKIFFIFPP